MIVDWAVRGTWRDSIVKTSIGLTLGLLATGCGQDYTGLFSRLPKQQLIFPNGDLGSALRLPNLISSKVDVLWIVESSSKINDVVGNDTMINQVVDGIQQFSDNYFNANNDFQMAVIPANYAPVLALDENEIPTNLNDPNFVNAPIVAPVFSSIPPSGSNIAQQKAAYIKAFTDIQDSVLNKNNITPPAAASTQGVFSYIRFLHKHEDRNFCSETSPDPLKRCLFRKGAIHAVFIVIKSCDSGAWNANLDYLAAASWKDSPFSLTVLPATGLTCVGNIGRVNPNQQCCGNHSSPSGGPYPPGVPISSNDSVSKPYFPGGFGSRDECHPMYSISRGPANNVGGGNFLDLHRYTMHFFTQLQQSQSEDIHYLVQGIGGNACGGSAYNFATFTSIANNVGLWFPGSLSGPSIPNSLAASSKFLLLTNSEIGTFFKDAVETLENNIQVVTDFPPFRLENAPSSRFGVQLFIVGADKNEREIPQTSFRITGDQLQITDASVIKSLKQDDSVRIVYIPETVIDRAKSS